LVEENIIKSEDVNNNNNGNKLFGDDYAYEGNEIFKYLEDNGILLCIKVRNNDRVGWMEKRTHS
jgi:hypothetical protein